MKALCVSGMPNPTPPTPPGTLSRRDEAHALAKRALTLRMSSHVCWHVYGLLYRADRNYAEAIKCYKRALKLEPSLNAGEGQILRDLSHLQIQERDVEGFVESRSALLAARPGQRYNWLPLAVGHHLTGVMMMGGGRGSGAGSSPSPSPASPSSSRPPSAAAAAADPSASTSTSGSNAESFLLAVSILDQYDSMASAEERDLPKRGTPEEFERSEIALYGAEVALEGGDAAGALARVEACLLALEDPREAKKLPWPPISPQSSAAAADAVAKPNVGAAPPARDLRYGVFDFFALFRVSSFCFAGAARELSERASPKGKTRKGKKSPLPRSPPPPPTPTHHHSNTSHRGARELRARCLEALGPSRAQEAQRAWRQLLNSNPDDARSHDGVRRALGLPELGRGPFTPEQIAPLRSLYDVIREDHPRSSMVSSAVLDFEEGERFVASADAVARRLVARGAPSLFSNLEPLYADPAKAEALGALFEGYKKALDATGQLPAPLGEKEEKAAAAANGDDVEEPSQSPAYSSSSPSPTEKTALLKLWVAFYRAQHADHWLGDTRLALEALGEAESALKAAGEAARHDAADVELARAAVLSRAGAPAAAAACALDAAASERGDRHASSQAAAALFAASPLVDGGGALAAAGAG